MRPPRSTPPPLDAAALDRLAIHYVGRYATSSAKLVAYLRRKITERGWEGPPADLEALAGRLTELGYIDDAAFAEARSRSLTRRGYGGRRVDAALRGAGISEEHRAAARPDQAAAVAAAIALARRRRIGPFAEAAGDRAVRARWLGTLLRAGHAMTLARTIVDLAPDQDPEGAIFRAAADFSA